RAAKVVSKAKSDLSFTRFSNLCNINFPASIATDSELKGEIPAAILKDDRTLQLDEMNGAALKDESYRKILYQLWEEFYNCHIHHKLY
ncbi:MAG: hypothetical protein ACKPHP_19885, partial [Dolichospermum sp.]